MKILTISGTRPDFLRLMPTIRKLDKYYNHKLVWAEQNYERCLSTQFFEEWNRHPDIVVDNIKTKLKGNQYVGLAISQIENILTKEKPDCVLVLGDTNASFAASFVTKKLGIILFHMEAGNRCYDPKRVPEEVNRYMIDSIADWHLCYTQRAREHLLLEGKRPDRCIVVGNPIKECVDETFQYMKRKRPENHKEFYLVTIHRKENLEEDRFLEILHYLTELDLPVKISNHPTFADNCKSQLGTNGKDLEPYKKYKNLELIDPPNFKEFLQLECFSECVITDSGTIPEECNLLERPCVLLRYSTERPELLEKNSMVVCSDSEDLQLAVKIAKDTNFPIPIEEYHNEVSNNVIKLLMRWKDD